MDPADSLLLAAILRDPAPHRRAPMRDATAQPRIGAAAHISATAPFAPCRIGQK